MATEADAHLPTPPSPSKRAGSHGLGTVVSGNTASSHAVQYNGHRIEQQNVKVDEQIGDRIGKVTSNRVSIDKAEITEVNQP